MRGEFLRQRAIYVLSARPKDWRDGVRPVGKLEFLWGRLHAIHSRALYLACTLGCLWMLLAIPIACSEALVFQPERTHELRIPNGQGDPSHPQQILPIEQVTLTSSRRDRLDCLWLRHPESRGAVLFLHGADRNVGHFTNWMRELAALQLDVLAVEYPGYGSSTGRPTERGCIAAAEAGYQWLRKAGIAPDRIIAVGYSLGGGVAIQLATRQPLAGLVVIASFTSIRAVADSYMSGATWFLGLYSPLNSERLAPRIQCPSLWIAAGKDQVIPPEQMRKLANQAPAPSTFVLLPEAEHNHILSEYDQPVLAAIRTMLERESLQDHVVDAKST